MECLEKPSPKAADYCNQFVAIALCGHLEQELKILVIVHNDSSRGHHEDLTVISRRPEVPTRHCRQWRDVGAIAIVTPGGRRSTSFMASRRYLAPKTYDCAIHMA